ncbi:hypothetical protein DEJ34_03860 [Curtobacterium sp. MCPF17_050]|uniref:hypothetical protein n=1 Tax=Curtobacterium sp. MCPF17_050 TaxID=2175664 RepID=UPI000D8D7BFD|nr:hypothetical protein [Curtobacterium sp. MCPF17_050]WIB16279.1 hypothetical protein DEJ34_03860 [Curtobacterium sp. MCPF17_050]
MGLIAGYTTPPDLSSPTPLEAEATAIQREFEQALQVIRSDTRTTAEGKRIAIAEIWAPAAERVAALQRRQQESYDSAVARLERQLYGTIDSSDSAAIVGTRDAFDRVEKLAAEQPPTGPLSAERQATQLLDRALKTGDQPLVRAIIATAMNRGWHELLAGFVAAHSDLGDPVSNMIELRKWDPAVRMVTYYTFRFPAPHEITGATIERAYEIADERSNPTSPLGTPQPAGPRPYIGEKPSWLSAHR